MIGKKTILRGEGWVDRLDHCCSWVDEGGSIWSNEVLKFSNREVQGLIPGPVTVTGFFLSKSDTRFPIWIDLVKKGTKFDPKSIKSVNARCEYINHRLPPHICGSLDCKIYGIQGLNMIYIHCKSKQCNRKLSLPWNRNHWNFCVIVCLVHDTKVDFLQKISRFT